MRSPCPREPPGALQVRRASLSSSVNWAQSQYTPQRPVVSRALQTAPDRTAPGTSCCLINVYNYYHPCPNPIYLTLQGPTGHLRGEFFFFSKLPQNISSDSHDIKLISQCIVNRFCSGYSSTQFSLPLGEMVSTQLSERPLRGVGYI